MFKCRSVVNENALSLGEGWPNIKLGLFENPTGSLGIELAAKSNFSLLFKSWKNAHSKCLNLAQLSVHVTGQ